MRKILFLNLYDDPADGGGAEMTLHHLTQGFLGRGLEPVMLSTTATPGLHRMERRGVRIWRAGMNNIFWPTMSEKRGVAERVLWHTLDSYNPLMQPVLRKVLEIERPDLVSIHNLPGWSAAAWRTIANAGIPAVQVLHDTYAICAKATMFKKDRNCQSQCSSCRMFRLPHRRLSSAVSAVVGVSRFILDRHLEQGYFRQVPIRRVIHNARDARELGVDSTASICNSNEVIRIGFIGRLEPAKGVERLLESFIQLQLPGAELWIAGSGKMDYEQSLRKRYASPHVHFLGRVAAREFYPRMNVVVVPSLWHDTFPGVVFEALVYGKPVIGTRRGGIPEMIRDGENGMLFEPDRPGELADCLVRFHADEFLRIRLAANAVASGKPFVDLPRWLDDYEMLYREILSRKDNTTNKNLKQNL